MCIRDRGTTVFRTGWLSVASAVEHQVGAGNAKNLRAACKGVPKSKSSLAGAATRVRRILADRHPVSNVAL
eukprot:5882562-Pyramimonas_sp.AAC.1